MSYGSSALNNFVGGLMLKFPSSRLRFSTSCLACSIRLSWSTKNKKSKIQLLFFKNFLGEVHSITGYTGLGYYTGIRTYTTDNFSPAQKQLTVCFVQSGIRIHRTLNLSPNPSPV